MIRKFRKPVKIWLITEQKCNATQRTTHWGFSWGEFTTSLTTFPGNQEMWIWKPCCYTIILYTVWRGHIGDSVFISSPGRCLSVVHRKPSHLNLLLWTKLNQIWLGRPMDGPLSKLCLTVLPFNQNCNHY